MSGGAAAREVVAVCPGVRLAVWGQHHPRARSPPSQRFQSVFTGAWRRGAASGAAAAFLLLFLSSSSGLGLRLSPASPTAPALPPAPRQLSAGAARAGPGPAPGWRSGAPPAPAGTPRGAGRRQGRGLFPPCRFVGKSSDPPGLGLPSVLVTRISLPGFSFCSKLVGGAGRDLLYLAF